jgi:ribosome-binding protein aMBF1 (putative translation factor)
MPKRLTRGRKVCLPPAERARLKRIREGVLKNDREELSKQARRFDERQQTVKVELARAAQLLRAERECQGLSLADIGKKSGISRAAICRLENLVDANPTISTLTRLADALGKRLVIAVEDR